VKRFVLLTMCNVALGVVAAPASAPIPATAPKPIAATTPAAPATQDGLVEIKKKAEGGDAAAQVAFGDELARMRKYRLAERWYSEAALKGAPNALFALADLYSGSRGEGTNAVKANLTNAMTLHKLAAAQGFTKSHLALGLAYKDGNNAPKDLVRAYTHLKLSDASQNRDLMLNQIIAEMSQAQTDEAEKIVKRFRPANFESAFADLVFDSIRISGIFGGGSNRIAMINGKQLNEGQQVSLNVGGLNAQVKLAEIASDGVFVSFRSQERKIKPQRL
jgi:hypothetical protein